MVGMIALLLPEMMILRKALKTRLIATFAAVLSEWRCFRETGNFGYLRS